MGLSIDVETEVATAVERIRSDGYCVLTDIIPADRVAAVRTEVVAAQQARAAEAEADQAATRARGHRVGAAGVGLLKQAVNATQCFVEYLADPRITGVAEELFGQFVRISCTDCVINNPGNERGYWHADWPYNATNSTHVKAPYPDVLMHLSSIWMLTRFGADNGGTFLLPGSHRYDNNPAASTKAGGEPLIIDDVAFDAEASHPRETQAAGEAGSVLLYDSRLWHAVAPNLSDEARVALIVRYAPWWLNLTPSMRGTPDNDRMVVETGGKNYDATPIRREVFDRLPEQVKPLYRHWVVD